MWSVSWLADLGKRGAVLTRSLREGLGRLSFAAGVLEWDRPLFSVLFAWDAAAPDGAYLPLPPMVALTVKYLKDRHQAPTLFPEDSAQKT
eukprot:13396384-Alexandrium_andersonii.AAC.1